MNLTFDHYGLHWIEGDIGLLVQRARVDHVLGVPMQFDVTVKIPRQGLICPHNIDINEAASVSLPDDPLVAAMLPLPKEFGSLPIVVEDTTDNKHLVRNLLRLSSSAGGEMRPIWFADPKVMAAQLQLTNISPLVLFGYSQEFLLSFRRVIEASYYSPRQLILLAPRFAVMPGEVSRHKPSITAKDVSDLPLEQAGAQHLKNHMLRKS